MRASKGKQEEYRTISRRTILKASAAMFAAGMLPASAVFGKVLDRTQDQILGPFYPIMSEPDRSGDLTRVPGGSGRAKGQPVIIRGTVRNPDGKPVLGAEVEIWQANAAGRYAHPDDTNPAPLDPNFQGFGAATTGPDGFYQFKTIKPLHYPAGSIGIRPAHIHFDIRGRRDELVTQMYFEGDPYNEKDSFLQSVLNPDALIVKLLSPTAEEPEFMVAVFDIVFRG
ncbi:protocatechuate 3,4-dioxygenase beta subunit [Nitrosospira multiformis]|uniref:Protocatechuate 3,4-dioxygenase beta subunit n=1 Tax=Nitrosospira multiformis TaxID=1231 RepID=A0A2T5I5Y2_9PROT|nr:protocatechuate 3,4-dioxygenase [Nitrosospira multiformis]PTQ79244.1 protocatechuate 3,4-dioxygenase beta subunit [Nitrosospira multiformis]